MLQSGFRLGQYEIHAPIDLGPCEAYRAYDHDQSRYVTLQIFRVEFGRDPDRLRAFEADVLRAMALSHPNILPIYEAGTDAHAAYVASAPCAGETLRARLDRQAVTLDDAARWSRAMTRALAAARRKDVRHGHLGEYTVIVDDAGHLVIVGFGLAAVAPPVRPSSDAAAVARMKRRMLRAGWHAAPRLRRHVWTTVLLLLGGIGVGVGVMSMPDGARDRGAAATADTAVATAAAPPAPEPLAVAPPVPAIPSAGLPADAPLAAPPPAAPVIPTRNDLNDADARRLPRPPSVKPVPAPVDAPAPAAPPAAPARPLTPVVADGRDTASLMTEASVRATEFDLAGAYELSRAAASRGDGAAQIAAPYLRGLIDARDAFRDGGPAEALAPVREAIGLLQGIARGRPGAAEIARLTLHAAAAAAQSERDEMSLYLETALEMESLQRMAGLPGAPLVSAAEVAGDLWLQVHRYEDARRAYTQAADRGGSTLRVLSGLARAARRLNDAASACASYRRLLDSWGGRPGLPVEVAEARAYIGGCAQ